MNSTNPAFNYLVTPPNPNPAPSKPTKRPPKMNLPAIPPYNPDSKKRILDNSSSSPRSVNSPSATPNLNLNNTSPASFNLVTMPGLQLQNVNVQNLDLTQATAMLHNSQMTNSQFHQQAHAQHQHLPLQNRLHSPSNPAPAFLQHPAHQHLPMPTPNLLTPSSNLNLNNVASQGMLNLTQPQNFMPTRNLIANGHHHHPNQVTSPMATPVPSGHFNFGVPLNGVQHNSNAHLSEGSNASATC